MSQPPPPTSTALAGLPGRGGQALLCPSSPRALWVVRVVFQFIKKLITYSLLLKSSISVTGAVFMVTCNGLKDNNKHSNSCECWGSSGFMWSVCPSPPGPGFDERAGLGMKFTNHKYINSVSFKGAEIVLIAVGDISCGHDNYLVSYQSAVRDLWPLIPCKIEKRH